MNATISALEALQPVQLDAGTVFSGQASGVPVNGYAKHAHTYLQSTQATLFRNQPATSFAGFCTGMTPCT